MSTRAEPAAGARGALPHANPRGRRSAHQGSVLQQPGSPARTTLGSTGMQLPGSLSNNRLFPDIREPAARARGVLPPMIMHHTHTRWRQVPGAPGQGPAAAAGAPRASTPWCTGCRRAAGSASRAGCRPTSPAAPRACAAAAARAPASSAWFSARSTVPCGLMDRLVRLLPAAYSVLRQHTYMTAVQASGSCLMQMHIYGAAVSVRELCVRACAVWVAIPRPTARLRGKLTTISPLANSRAANTPRSPSVPGTAPTVTSACMHSACSAQPGTDGEAVQACQNYVIR